MKPALLIAMLVGCEQNLLAEIPDASQQCPPPSQPLAVGRYKVFLNTEGVTLANGAPDSRANVSDIVPTTSAAVPPFLDGVAGREDFIARIVSTAQSVLAPYSIDIVTTRPTSGDYYMFVLGGDAATVLSSGCANCFGQADFNCVVLGRDDVDVIFDLGMDLPDHSPVFYANTVLAYVGDLAGLGGTASSADCECRVDASCLLADAPLCSYGTKVATTNATYGAGAPANCGRTPTQDEPLLLETAYGCR